MKSRRGRCLRGTQGWLLCFGWDPKSLATSLRFHPNGVPLWNGIAVGETPTAAVETTALPKKSLRI
jgi:hypothetical protein